MRNVRRRVTAAVLGAGLAALGVLAPSVPATAAPPTSDPAAAASYGAAWIARQLGTRGWLASPTDPGTPDLNTTAYGVVALATTRAGGTAAGTALAYLKAHLDEYVRVAGADAPGPLATLVLATHALGENPRSYFGSDLVARLQATRQANGLFGGADPTYDGAYRQGLALAALGAAGVTDQAATDWLRAQQCDEGGWLAFRADTSTPCAPADPVNFTGPDSNSTAMAVMGLVAQDATPRVDALGWFDTTQGTDGGWAYVAAANQPSDANSTALAIQAVTALGGDVRSSRFAQGGRSPFDALLSFQLGCADSASDAGAFAYQPTRGTLTANSLATVQAVPAAAGAPLPVAPATLADAAPAAVTCAAAAPAPAASPGGSSATGAGAIADTGAGTDVLTGAGVALVLGGVALCSAGRRRRAPVVQ